MDRIDLASRTATTLLTKPRVLQNSINIDTVLAPAPNGSSIMAASADGTVFLYDAGADTFTVSRKISTSSAGAYAASSDGWFVVGSSLLNTSLVPITTWPGAQFFSGFTLLGRAGIPVDRSSGRYWRGRLDPACQPAIRCPTLPTRVIEQPLASASPSVFTRTLAPLANGSAVIALTTSGFTVLAANFDAATVAPSVTSVVKAADLTSLVAPGSLISVFGDNLNPTNIATSEIPLPTFLGQLVGAKHGSGPNLPHSQRRGYSQVYASPSQINAQLPPHLAGQATLTLYTPGGTSDDYGLNIQPVAPAIFQSGSPVP